MAKNAYDFTFTGTNGINPYTVLVSSGSSGSTAKAASESTEQFDWDNLLPDLPDHTMQSTGVGFKVEVPLKRPLSVEHKFDAQRPWDAYDPMLHVLRTFEFTRPRTQTLGLGLVHFKYSQRAVAERRPAWIHDNYVTQEYVDQVVAGMQHDFDWDDISKIRLLRWDYNSCTFEVVRTIDGRDVTIKLDGRPGDTDTGIIKPNFEVQWNDWHYNHYAHQFKDELQLDFVQQNVAEYEFFPNAVDEYSVKSGRQYRTTNNVLGIPLRL